MRLYFFVFVAMMMAFAGCSRGPAKISIANKSGITLDKVTVSGENFATLLGSMPDGVSMNFALQERSQTNVWITFTAKDKGIDSRGNGRPFYYRVDSRHPLSLTIETDLKVEEQ